MPLYEYRCIDCSATDHRVAGIDDHTALCVECGGLMLRLDEDVFRGLEPDPEPGFKLPCPPALSITSLRQTEKRDCHRYKECFNEAAIKNLPAGPCQDCHEI